DLTCLQFKRLNSRKGPAVRGTRMQSDKEKYAREMRSRLARQANLSLLQGEVKRLILRRSSTGQAIVEGVVLQDSSRIRARSVILTYGSVMNGIIHMGEERTAGRRVGD